MQLQKVMIPIRNLGITLDGEMHSINGNTFAICASGECPQVYTAYFATKKEAFEEAIKKAEAFADDFLAILRSDTYDFDTVDASLKTILLNNVATFTTFENRVGIGKIIIYSDLFTIAMACYKKVLKEVLPF